jgi:hypothetical protein
VLRLAVYGIVNPWSCTSCSGLQWPAAVQSGAVAPLAIEFDGGRGIRYHPDRLALGKEPRDIFRPDCTFRTAPDVFQTRNSPTPRHGFLGMGVAALARSSSGIANNPLSSPASKPVRLRAKSAALSSSSSREGRFSSQSAQVTERHHPAESFNFLRGPLNRFIAGAMQVAPGSRPSSSPWVRPNPCCASIQNTRNGASEHL